MHSNVALSPQVLAKYRRVYIVSNVCVALLAVLMFVVVDAPLAGSIVFAVLWVGLGLVFVVYAWLIGSRLGKRPGGKSTTSSKSQSQSQKKSSVQARTIIWSGIVVVVCFVGEAVVSVFTVAVGVYRMKTLAYATAAYNVLDLASLITVCYMYKMKVASLRTEATATRNRSQCRKSTLSRKGKGKGNINLSYKNYKIPTMRESMKR